MDMNLKEAVDQAVSDFDEIETAIEDNGVEIPDMTPTRDYDEYINQIPTVVSPRKIITGLATEEVKRNNLVKVGPLESKYEMERGNNLTMNINIPNRYYYYYDDTFGTASLEYLFNRYTFNWLGTDYTNFGVGSYSPSGVVEYTKNDKYNYTLNKYKQIDSNFIVYNEDSQYFKDRINPNATYQYVTKNLCVVPNTKLKDMADKLKQKILDGGGVSELLKPIVDDTWIANYFDIFNEDLSALYKFSSPLTQYPIISHSLPNFKTFEKDGVYYHPTLVSLNAQYSSNTRYTYHNNTGTFTSTEPYYGTFHWYELMLFKYDSDLDYWVYYKTLDTDRIEGLNEMLDKVFITSSTYPTTSYPDKPNCTYSDYFLYTNSYSIIKEANAVPINIRLGAITKSEGQVIPPTYTIYLHQFDVDELEFSSENKILLSKDKIISYNYITVMYDKNGICIGSMNFSNSSSSNHFLWNCKFGEDAIYNRLFDMPQPKINANFSPKLYKNGLGNLLEYNGYIYVFYVSFSALNPDNDNKPELGLRMNYPVRQSISNFNWEKAFDEDLYGITGTEGPVTKPPLSMQYPEYPTKTGIPEDGSRYSGSFVLNPADGKFYCCNLCDQCYVYTAQNTRSIIGYMIYFIKLDIETGELEYIYTKYYAPKWMDIDNPSEQLPGNRNGFYGWDITEPGRIIGYMSNAPASSDNRVTKFVRDTYTFQRSETGDIELVRDIRNAQHIGVVTDSALKGDKVPVKVWTEMDS